MDGIMNVLMVLFFGCVVVIMAGIAVVLWKLIRNGEFDK